MNFRKYKNDLVRPKDVDKSDYPNIRDFYTHEEWGKAIDLWEIEFTKRKLKHKKQLTAYNAKTAELDKQFWDDLYKELDWIDIPDNVLSELNSYIYDKGHPQGYPSIYDYAVGLCGIVYAYKQERKNKE